MTGTGILWRDTARPVSCFGLDARALVGFMLWALHMCWPTFILSLVCVAVFVICQRFGASPAAAWRYIRLACFSDVRERQSLYHFRRNARW
ncbi:MAG: IcmT/TraK family protein [Desulfovibrio sp.]|jgi:ABC-type dipeptide/oligopeptide/nickel transport system permease component|nr:IcmT/TraK family protein [Desulfovibrio sp.]